MTERRVLVSFLYTSNSTPLFSFIILTSRKRISTFHQVSNISCLLPSFTIARTSSTQRNQTLGMAPFPYIFLSKSAMKISLNTGDRSPFPFHCPFGPLIRFGFLFSEVLSCCSIHSFNFRKASFTGMLGNSTLTSYDT